MIRFAVSAFVCFGIIVAAHLMSDSFAGGYIAGCVWIISARVIDRLSK